jgi:hypothetical protein
MQFLKTANDLRPHSRSARVAAFNKDIQTPIELISDIGKLKTAERALLTAQIRRCLSLERRRCNARAHTYDVNRHIRLYVTLKALETLQTKNGPLRSRFI